MCVPLIFCHRASPCSQSVNEGGQVGAGNAKWPRDGLRVDLTVLFVGPDVELFSSQELFEYAQY